MKANRDFKFSSGLMIRIFFDHISGDWAGKAYWTPYHFGRNLFCDGKEMVNYANYTEVVHHKDRNMVPRLLRTAIAEKKYPKVGEISERIKKHRGRHGP